MPLQDGYILTQTAGTIGPTIRETEGDVIQPIRCNFSSIVDGQVLTYQAGTNSFVGSSGGAATFPYSVYTALISQVGGAAPTATVLQDTITGLVWSRFLAGQYILTKNGVMLANKIFFFIGENRTIAEFASGVYFSVNRSDNNSIVIGSSQGTPFAGLDGLLNNTPFELRIYP